MPGPLFTFSAFLGTAMSTGPGGWAGGMICLCAIFLPSLLLVLGVLHLGNVYVLNRIRRRGLMEREQVPPVPPQGWTTGPGHQGPWAAPAAGK